MTYPIYPTTPRYSYGLKDGLAFSTNIQTPLNWKGELIAPLWEDPRRKITLNYQALTQDGFDNLRGFFRAMHGPATPFYLDLRNGATGFKYVGQLLGTGDASEDTFQIVRNLGSYFDEPWKYILETPNIYLGGVLQESGYIIDGDGQVVFTSPPGEGIAVTADFSPALLCRFANDEDDYEKFTINFWRMGQVELIEAAP